MEEEREEQNREGEVSVMKRQVTALCLNGEVALAAIHLEQL